MLRLPYLRFLLAATAAALVVCSGLDRAIAVSVSRLIAANAKLWLTSSRRVAPAGSPIFLTAHLRNIGKRPIYIPRGLGPLQFFKVKVKYLGHPGPVRFLRAGVMGSEMNVGSLVAVAALPGRTIRFWTKAPINRYFDMSMPGRYAVRFSVGRLESNWLNVTIKPPEVQLPVGKILRPSAENWPSGGKNKRGGVQVRIFGLAHGGKTQPVGVWVYLRGGGLGKETAELTGNRLSDLQAIQVNGPDGHNGVELVKKPKPHYILILNHHQVALTAYGKWLLRHPPRGLPAKRFILKPGVAYKYAVPINLACQFDMSLSGVYHIRIELAHPRVWSNWVYIKVPSLEVIVPRK